MKSSAQLQREAQAQRAELSSTLDLLGDSMTAKQISTELFTLAKESGVSIVRSLAQSARDNPVPALLIGVGLAMMVTKSAGGNDLAAKAGAMLKDAVTSGTSAVKGAATGIGDAVTGAAQSAADSVRHGVDVAADKATRASDSSLEAADGVMQRGREQARQVADKAEALASQGQDALRKLADEQPVLLAAVGAVLGAALGAALPVSEAERRYFGDVSSKAMRAGKQTAAKVAGIVKEEALGDHPETKVAAVAEKVLHAVTTGLGKDTGQDIGKPVPVGSQAFSEPRRKSMNGIIYIVGLIVVVLAILSFIGLR